jgi:hypothetical protein
MKRTRSKLTPELRKAKRAYWTQKYNALNRGLVMELTFEQWYDIWITSGHWEQRGSKLGNYCMCRIGDKGHYSLGNVFIATVSENIVGRPTVGSYAMTNAERQRRWRAKQKEMK